MNFFIKTNRLVKPCVTRLLNMPYVLKGGRYDEK
ncbi:hypothetical protein BN3590_02890 [Clostridium sp. C105KSO15]|nr:hypothetical protein BN3590_02890 [Clostridium sp. C105KSO15]